MSWEVQNRLILGGMGRDELGGGGGGERTAAHSSQDEMLNEKGSMGNGLLWCMGFDSCCSGESESGGELVGLATAIVNSSKCLANSQNFQSREADNGAF